MIDIDFCSTRFMPARRLLASTLLGCLIVGCGSDNDDNTQTSEVPSSIAIPFDVSPDGIRPLATDLVPRQTEEGNDGTFAIAPDTSNPVVTAISQLDGFSNNASLDIPMPAAIDANTLIPQNSIYLLNAQTRQLVPISVRALTLVGGGFAVRILPNTVLSPKTQYLVVLTQGIKTTNGEPLALPSLFEQSLASGTGNAALDGAIQGWTSAADELLRQTNVLDDVALAYTFTTVSTTDVLTTVAQSAQLVAAQDINFIPLPDSPRSSNGGALLFLSEDPTQSDPLTTVHQGQIALPQGHTAPSLASGALDSFWSNDTGNISASNRVPAIVGSEYSPILVTLPGGDYSAIGGQDCSDITRFTIVVFVHGITGDRSNSLRLAQRFASQACIATVVIDQPEHGMAPLTSDGERNAITPMISINANFASSSAWAATVAGLSQAGNTTFDNLSERHDDIGVDTMMNRAAFSYDADNPLGASGTNFINLLNFARTRDNLRQAVWDQMTLLASLSNVNINGLTLNTDNVHMIGHSLGAIVATTTAHLVNSLPENERLPNVQTLTAANPGAQITRLLQNSPLFRGQIIGGLAANGIAEGSVAFESFMHIFQAMIDSADPLNFIGLNTSNATPTPTLMFEMVGGGALAESADFGPLNEVRAAFQGVYPRDHVVPNFDYAGSNGLPYANLLGDTSGFNTVIDSASSPLVGTTPLATVGRLRLVTQSIAPEGNRLLVRMQNGTHSTFASGDDPAAFDEMVTQTLNFIQNGEITVTNTAVIAP